MDFSKTEAAKNIIDMSVMYPLPGKRFLNYWHPDMDLYFLFWVLTTRKKSTNQKYLLDVGSSFVAVITRMYCKVFYLVYSSMYCKVFNYADPHNFSLNSMCNLMWFDFFSQFFCFHVMLLEKQYLEANCASSWPLPRKVQFNFVLFMLSDLIDHKFIPWSQPWEIW